MASRVSLTWSGGVAFVLLTLVRRCGYPANMSWKDLDIPSTARLCNRFPI